MVKQAGIFSAWLIRILLRDPESLLSLLIEAHHIDRDRVSLAIAFRAGLRVGIKHPEAARRILGEAEYNI